MDNLNEEQVNDIFTDIIDDFIPESEDNINENYSKELKTLRNDLKWYMKS